jgi:hypothetical protein
VKHRQYRRKGKHIARQARRPLVVASAALFVGASAAGLLSHDVNRPVVLVDSAAANSHTAVAGDDTSRSTPRAARKSAPSNPAVPAPSQAPPSLAPPASLVPKPAGPPVPVAGLDQAQMDNALAIVREGEKRGLSRQAQVVAVATALQESNLYNYASAVLPESLGYAHQAVGADFDSVGLFQQRPSMGWGAVSQLMDPAFASGMFYTGLMQVPGWESMPLTAAAQAVQKSAYPDAYQKHESRAYQVVVALETGG